MNKEIIKLGLILCVIGAIASGLLAFVNDITEPIIQIRNEQEANNARSQILPEADSFEKMDIANDSSILEVYKGLKGSEVVGYTIKTEPKGYGGGVEVVTGVSIDGVISGVSLGNMNETPGLGAKAKDVEFISQFNGKKSDSSINVIKSGTPSESDIVAISGATITSKAVSDGVNLSLEYYNNQLK